MRTFELAASSLGGVGQLAAKLRASSVDVERWIAGIPPPPDVDTYSRALDVVSAGPPDSRD